MYYAVKPIFTPIFSSLPGNNGPTYKDFPLCGESKLVLCVFSDSPFVVSLHRFTRLCGNYSIWGAVFKAKSRESHSGIHFSTLTMYSRVEANRHWPFTISWIFYILEWVNPSFCAMISVALYNIRSLYKCLCEYEYVRMWTQTNEEQLLGYWVHTYRFGQRKCVDRGCTPCTSSPFECRPALKLRGISVLP